MNEKLMPQLSPPVARTIHTLGARATERGGVGPSRQEDVDAEDGPLVPSFPSVKFVGAGAPSGGYYYQPPPRQSWSSYRGGWW